MEHKLVRACASGRLGVPFEICRITIRSAFRPTVEEMDINEPLRVVKFKLGGGFKCFLFYLNIYIYIYHIYIYICFFSPRAPT